MIKKTMKLSHIILSTLLCVFAATQIQAQTTQNFNASKDNQYGLRYTLPRTVVDISIETAHSHFVPGEFYNYASRHLAISNAITEESTTVEIRSISIATRGVADPDNQWLVQFKRGAAVSMCLTPDGIPLTINTDSIIETADIEFLETEQAMPTILETDAVRHAMTQEMIMSSSISKRAELAANRIFELREMRNDLLAGQYDNPPADGKAMQLVLDNLANQEAALTAMFAGTEKTWTNVKTISICPDTLDVEREVIARISPFDGVLDADNLAGSPLSISVEILERGEIPLTPEGFEKTFPKGGVAYIIPGKARISVKYEGKEVANTEVTLAQLGGVFGIDPALFSDKKAPSMLQFDPATGAIIYLGPITKTPTPASSSIL